MLDRMDILLDVRPVAFNDLAATHSGSDSQSMRHRVDIARRMQQERFAKETYRFNGQIPAGEVARFCLLTHPAQQLFQAAYQRLGYSSRGYHRLLRMARTIADLDDCSMIQEQHMAQALQYRRMDIR
jgi:magnesium chelatase family protein